MSWSTLSQPFSIDGRTLPNRIVLPPLVIWKAGEDGAVAEAHRTHYASFSGPGLMIVEATAVAPEGRLAATQLGLWDDSQVPGLLEIATIIRDSNAVPGIQIHHAGGRANHETTYGLDPVVPSLLPDSPEGARELTQDDIEQLIQSFATTAARAADAGFDLIEVHGAHGYLGSQFLSPRTNKRSDQWGGSIANRARFLSRVVSEVSKAVTDRRGDGTAPLITCRLGAAERAGDEAYLTEEEGVEAARLIEAAGAAVLHVSHGGSMPRQAAPEDARYSPLVYLAGRVREAVGVPVIAVDGIRMPDVADAVLAEGYADLVAVGRGQLADPHWAQKALDEHPEHIERCRECKPRCYHFTEPERCPARAALSRDASNGR